MNERSFLSTDACRALFDRIVKLTTGGGQTHVSIQSRWTGTTKWLRNRVSITGSAETVELTIRRNIRDTEAEVTTSRVDDVGLLEAVRAAEHIRTFMPEAPREIVEPFVEEPMVKPVLWSDATFALSAESRSELAWKMMEPIEAAGLFGAGVLSLAAEGHAEINTDGRFRYYPVTAVECSTTVRGADGRSSGWAGVTHYDLAKIDPPALAARALDKCQRWANAKAVEPGRYTAILEPQAVHDLFAPLIDRAMIRPEAEGPFHPFSGVSAESRSKIGSRVLDRGLMVSADPMDPEAGFVPFEEGTGAPFRAVTWVDRGVLRELAYDRWYSARNLGTAVSQPNSKSFNLRAAPDVPLKSIDEMIASTLRGLLVTRFSNVELLHFPSMFCSGFTRDGVWLIEKGKVTTPVRNFRFMDSPLFALNTVEAIGPSVRVFSPGYARVAPAVKVKEFNFSSLADAV